MKVASEALVITGKNNHISKPFYFLPIENIVASPRHNDYGIVKNNPDLATKVEKVL